VVHSCNHSPWEAEAGVHEFKVSLSYIAILCLKKSKQNKMVEDFKNKLYFE
jgi:hypothetical protein